jgi:hypothetical protein
MRTVLVMIGVASLAGSCPEAATTKILEPPQGFFQEGPSLDVVVAYATHGGGRTRIRLLVDGEEVSERSVAGENGTIQVTIPLDAGKPMALIQACAFPGEVPQDSGSCHAVRAAGIREFDLARQTLEEMNDIVDAVMRYASLRLRYDELPQSLGVLIPEFLDRLPVESPLGTPYQYTSEGPRFLLRAALPGSGEIRNQDGAFARLPPGVITDREAARLTRDQLLSLGTALESYRVDHNQYPATIEDLFPIYTRLSSLTDPYGRQVQCFLAPQEYALTAWGRDGHPGGTGFDADTVVVNGPRLTLTTPYRGRYEYARQTFRDMSGIVRALSSYRDEKGRWPGSLSQLNEGPFLDFCGNPYVYEFTETAPGGQYRLRAFGCAGTPDTDPIQQILDSFGAADGRVTGPSGSPFPVQSPWD